MEVDTEPTTSNITRRKPAVRGGNARESPSAPERKTHGNKIFHSDDFASSPLMQEVKTHVDEILNKKKIGSLNCFDFKSPLELYGLETMLANNATIQEMSVVLESVQSVFAHRVDRLHTDVRSVDEAISNGDMTRGANGKNDVQISLENRKMKKQMAVADGLNAMSDYYLNQDMEMDYDYRGRNNEDEEDDVGSAEREDQPEEEVTIAGEPNIDVRANSKDVDAFLERNAIPEEIIKNIAYHRASSFRAELSKDVSNFICVEDDVNNMKDVSIDWMKANPSFQKATKGSVNKDTTAFHSLNFNGIHSPSGRALLLHPSIVDKNAGDPFFPEHLTVPLANNTRILLENSLAKKPIILDNFLMLEVRDRPIIGRYKISSSDHKKSTLPLAEGDRERDLANLTFAEMNARPVNLDTTIAGSSEMSMIRGNALPIGSNDQTIISGRATPDLNQTVSGTSRMANDEYLLPKLDALDLEESLIGKLPHDPMEMDELKTIFDAKIKGFRENEDYASKVWKNGIRAEEWGADADASLRSETRNVVQSGIDGWVKASDAWTNCEVVKMVVNRESRSQLDENARDEQESYRNIVPEIGKNLFLVRSDDFLNLYPGDKNPNIVMDGENEDVSKLHAAEDVEDVPLEQIQQELQKQRAQNEPQFEAMEDMDYESGGAVDVVFDDRLAAPADMDELMEPAGNQEGDEPIADILFNDQMDTTEEVRDEHAVQRDIEKIALGPEEVPILMTETPLPQVVGPSAEMREEIRNIGKTDNAYWVPPEVADQEKHAAVLAQRKRREKRTRARKLTVEDFAHYFRDVPEEEIARESTAARCAKIADEKSTFLTEQQIYLPTLGIENKPHVAFEMGLLGKSGLFFQKSYGKIRLERVKHQKPEQEMFMEDNRGNRDSDCLNWLLSFSGFRCMENVEPITETELETSTAQEHQGDDYVANFYDDDYDRYDPRWEQEMAAAQMGPDMRRKFDETFNHINRLLPALHQYREHGEFEDSDDEFEDSFDRRTIQTRNLDAAKHKKCLADILKNDTLSMPSIQYALETLTLNQTTRQNNTTSRGKNVTVKSPNTSVDADTTLTAVFEYHSPSRMNHDVTQIMKALTDTSDYEGEESRSEPQPSTSQYGTVNTENRKVTINGFHTLLSLALSMPSKMGESVRPSSIVSFILHLCNESSLKIVQDRSKRSWMSDFIVLNHSESLPRGLKMGKLDDQDEFWKKTQDPDAVEGAPADQSAVFANLIRPKAVAVRRRGANRPTTSDDMSAIMEEAEEEAMNE